MVSQVVARVLLGSYYNIPHRWWDVAGVCTLDSFLIFSLSDSHKKWPDKFGVCFFCSHCTLLQFSSVSTFTESPRTSVYSIFFTRTLYSIITETLLLSSMYFFSLSSLSFSSFSLHISLSKEKKKRDIIKS